MSTYAEPAHNRRAPRALSVNRVPVSRAMATGAVVLGLLLAGCDEPNASDRAAGSKAAQESAKAVPDFAMYDGPDDPAGFAAKYKGHCSGGSCIIETQPLTAPLKKADGEPLCAVGKYERQAVVTAHFGRDDRFQGAGCMIGGADYDEIRDRYGRGNVHKRYINQRGVLEDFLTWKTKDGFITTYREILGRAPSGGVLVSYHVYVGPAEHRYYSEYAYD